VFAGVAAEHQEREQRQRGCEVGERLGRSDQSAAKQRCARHERHQRHAALLGVQHDVALRRLWRHLIGTSIRVV
jgi:hypothetical protein